MDGRMMEKLRVASGDPPTRWRGYGVTRGKRQ